MDLLLLTHQILLVTGFFLYDSFGTEVTYLTNNTTS